jgi:penicillin amidase
MTMHLLNKADNYEDYAEAITYFNCPGQNLVFADRQNNIAIWQQGKFPLRWKEQGKFIMDGANKENDITGRIPQKHNAHVVNPERGFVSSANQHPTDSTYPYYYTGMFENYRNRRVNDELTRLNGIEPQDMQNLQLDN